MGLEQIFLKGIFGALGEKVGTWIPTKEGVMRRKIKTYEDKIKELEALAWTADIGREHDRINKLLRTEKENLDRHLAANK